MGNFFEKFKDPKYLLKVAVIAVIYYFSAKFGLSLAYSVKQVSLVWPPTGISLAALLIFGIDLWPAIFIGAFISNVTSMETPTIAFGIAIGNTLEASVGAFLLKAFDFRRGFERVKDVVLFILLAAGLSTMISATIGTASLIYGGIGSWNGFWGVWQNWWVGDFLGSMIVAPAILVWSRATKFRFDIFSIIEGVLLFLVISLVSIGIFTGTFLPFSYAIQNQFKYLIFPLLIWAAYRFRQKGSTLMVLVVVGISVWGVITGSGPFILTDPETSLLYLGVFAASISLTFMIFSVIMEERDSAEKKVSVSEKKFRSLIENGSDAIFLVDMQGTILFASQSVKRVLGYEPETLVGTNGFRLIYKDDLYITRETLKKLLENPGKTLSLENRLILKNGDVRWMEAEGVNQLGDPDIDGIVINFRDIDDRKQLDKVKTEFISLSAHQLRAPLSTIRWYTEYLVGSKVFPEALRSYISEVYKSVLIMNDTVNLLLDVSRFELGKVQVSAVPVNLPLIVKGMIEEKGNALTARKIKVTDSTKAKIPEIIGEPKLIRVIIENLLSNAIKYTPEGGKIDISLTPQAENILFKIQDTGVGIPASEQAKIFTKSFRGSNVKKVDPGGLGLGLYLIRLIVNLKGGKIWFESVEGKGTTFFVEFPKEIKINAKRQEK